MDGWAMVANRERAGVRVPRVLLVDDSESTLKAATLLLESSGYEVVSTNTPVGLGPLMLREKPDLVLVDVEMPEMRGDSLVKAARRLLKERCCPMLLWSSLPAGELEELARSSGATGYIHKSGGREMMERIAEVLGHSDHSGSPTPSACEHVRKVPKPALRSSSNRCAAHAETARFA
jgi:CheY-like chemotaxis protein